MALAGAHTDQGALGKPRARGLHVRRGFCGVMPLQHSRAAHGHRAHALLGYWGTEWFFPSETGHQTSKSTVVASIEAVAVGQCLPLAAENGQRRFGGHACRVAGSQYLASVGVELSLGQVLGRWESVAILRHVMAATLAAITLAFREEVLGP